jgi:hypothetical protein
MDITWVPEADRFAHDRNSGGTPSSTATLISRYANPHSTHTAPNAAHPRVVIVVAGARGVTSA